MDKYIPPHENPANRIRAVALAFCGLLLLSSAVAVGQQNPTLVSVNSAGTGSGNFRSDDWNNYRITPDGRYVVFRSEATNLVPQGTARQGHIFVRDLQTGTTRWISVSLTGSSPNGGSTSCRISDNGRYVAFTSFANNFVTNDTSATPDVFLRDLQTDTTTLVSVNTLGNSGTFNASELIDMTPDGRFITFWSHARDLTPHPDGNATGTDIYVRDMVSQVTKLVTVNAAGTASGNGNSYGGTDFGGSITNDGRYMVFTSEASDLVANDTSTRDVFLRDLQAGTTIRLSTNVAGTAGGNGPSGKPVIDRNGRFVVFETQATDLTTVLDRNKLRDIVIYDVQTGIKKLLTLNAAGTETAPGIESNTISMGVDYNISDDSRFVVFESHLRGMVTNDPHNEHDVFLYDVASQSRTLVSVNLAGTTGTGGSYTPSVSANGRFVTFQSFANDLANGQNESNENDDDIFVRDVVAGKTYVASVNSSGAAPGNFTSINPFVSADGTRVVFHSRASDLTPNDLNGFAEDIFVYTILANDPAVLIKEANTERAVALDSVTHTRDPFTLGNPFFATDGRTRVSLFVRGLVLIPGETAAVLTAQAEDEQGRVYTLPVEYVGATPGLLSINQVVVKLSEEITTTGDYSVRIRLRGINSSTALINIKVP